MTKKMINWRNFKHVCRYYEMDYDMDKHLCLDKQNEDRKFLGKNENGRVYRYRPCCERSCPFWRSA